jgi:hypothetical protein
MRLGISIVGQYMGIKPDVGFGAQIRVRTGDEYVRNGERKPGREENVDFFPFNPADGKPSLPSDLIEGCFVVCEVSARTKGYRSLDRGVSGMTLYQLDRIVIIDSTDFQRVAAENLLTEMSLGVE